ncbi:MAG: hypothetical protein IPL39_02465 [Opitutaceae bacterium]|nr:hypothetical protein [Opitutaceae bacterium]
MSACGPACCCYCRVPPSGWFYRYDAVGRLTWSVQPGGQATHFVSRPGRQHHNNPGGNAGPRSPDADGLPDTWKSATRRETGRTATADPDADGLVDLQEFAFTRQPDRG